MKLKKAWYVETGHNETIIVEASDTGTLNWAKRHNYKVTRIKLLTPNSN